MSDFSKLYNYILNKEHHKYRHFVDWNLAEEFSSKGLSPIERMSERFTRLCNEEKAVILENEQIVFLRTVSNLPAIFTEDEWNEINSKHFIHELGYLSNLSPDYEGVIKSGLLEVQKNADEYGKRSINAIFDLCNRYKKEAEKCGKTRAHTAHYDGFAVIFRELNKSS